MSSTNFLDMFNQTIKIEEDIIFAEDLKIDQCLYVVDEVDISKFIYKNFRKGQKYRLKG